MISRWQVPSWNRPKAQRDTKQCIWDEGSWSGKMILGVGIMRTYEKGEMSLSQHNT